MVVMVFIVNSKSNVKIAKNQGLQSNSNHSTKWMIKEYNRSHYKIFSNSVLFNVYMANKPVIVINAGCHNYTKSITLRVS